MDIELEHAVSMPEEPPATGTPLVTFALFAYNQAAFVKQALEGALAQECEPIEIILSDDASTDATFRLMQDAVADYSGPHSIKLNQNTKNLGLVRHVNKVLAMAKGRIVVLAAGDDISLPSRVSDTIATFQRHPAASMVSFIDEIIDEGGQEVLVPGAEPIETTFDLSAFVARGPLAQRQLQVSGASRAILRSTFETFGDLLPDCPAEDTPYILRSLYSGYGVVCRWAGIRYRQHGSQLSTEQSIVGMDLGKFTDQYMLDLATAKRKRLLGEGLEAAVRQWIDESDLLFQLRRIEYERDGLTLQIVVKSARSSLLPLRQKLGLIKRFLLHSTFGDRVRRGKAHLIDVGRRPHEYLRHIAFGRARTDIARWALRSSFQGDWDLRTKMLARHLRAGDRIAEFGAGMQAIRGVLPSGCTYEPFDLIARTVDTRVCDLNVGFPVDHGECNVAIFSGVLEYLQDLEATFAWLGGTFERVIFSYAVSDRVASPLVRNRHGWVNNFSRREVLALARRNGFKCRAVDIWGSHVLFVAERS
jgi:hypothetical protein